MCCVGPSREGLARPSSRSALAARLHSSLLARTLVLLSKSGIYLFFGFLSTASAVPGPGDEAQPASKEFTVGETRLFLCVS